MNSHMSTSAFDQRLPPVSSAASSNGYRHYQHHVHGSQHSMPYYNPRLSAGPSPASYYESAAGNSGGASSSVSMSLSPQPPSSSAPLQQTPAIKGKRKRASPQQLEVLNKVFASTSFPPTDMRNSLARELGMTPRTVQIWFQNKRQASRQRDGNHSRNTKSMAGPGTGILKGSRSMSPASTSGGHASPSPTASHTPSTTAASEQQLMVLVDVATATSDSASVLQTQGRVATAGCKDNAYVTAPSYQQYTKQGEGITPPSFSSAPLPSMCLGASQTPGEMMAEEPRALGRQAIVSSSDAYVSSALAASSKRHSSGSQYAHTRHDMWFAEDAPARLDYLYSHNARSQLLSPRTRPRNTAAHACSAIAAAAAAGDKSESRMQAPPPRTVPVQRSMSLMDMLNAPPEQRRLPPLPSIASLGN
ncbi:hypothetical protein LPJ56_003995 [Coemansia sp. RSA 2599]|nr:hypothetical protein LPJ56_003995 [Coemansia sp. RSA 2599]